MIKNKGKKINKERNTQAKGEVKKTRNSLTYSWSRALLGKPPIVQLLKNFPEFYGTQNFITVLTRALHRSLF
jgi:hypothetical protein